MMLDSWVWIEFFKEGPRSQAIGDLILGKDLFTSVLSLAEVSFWLSCNGIQRPETYLQKIRKNSTVLFLDEIVAEQAGATLPSLRRRAKDLGMVDALIYTQAQSSQMPLVSGDPHFKELQDVHFIE